MVDKTRNLQNKVNKEDNQVKCSSLMKAKSKAYAQMLRPDSKQIDNFLFLRNMDVVSNQSWYA